MDRHSDLFDLICSKITYGIISLPFFGALVYVYHAELPPATTSSVIERAHLAVTRNVYRDRQTPPSSLLDIRH